MESLARHLAFPIGSRRAGHMGLHFDCGNMYDYPNQTFAGREPLQGFFVRKLQVLTSFGDFKGTSKFWHLLSVNTRQSVVSDQKIRTFNMQSDKRKKSFSIPPIKTMFLKKLSDLLSIYMGEITYIRHYKVMTIYIHRVMTPPRPRSHVEIEAMWTLIGTTKERNPSSNDNTISHGFRSSIGVILSYACPIISRSLLSWCLSLGRIFPSLRQIYLN